MSSSERVIVTYSVNGTTTRHAYEAHRVSLQTVATPGSDTMHVVIKKFADDGDDAFETIHIAAAWTAQRSHVVRRV